MFIFATSPLKPMYAAEVAPLAPLELHLVESYPVGAVRAARAVITPGWVVSTVNVPQLKASAKVIFSEEASWPTVVKPLSFSRS